MKNDFREFYDEDYILHSTMTNLSEDELMHGEWLNKFRKYVDKIKTATGKWRYIYPEDLKKAGRKVLNKGKQILKEDAEFYKGVAKKINDKHHFNRVQKESKKNKFYNHGYPDSTTGLKSNFRNEKFDPERRKISKANQLSRTPLKSRENTEWHMDKKYYPNSDKKKYTSRRATNLEAWQRDQRGASDYARVTSREANRIAQKRRSESEAKAAKLKARRTAEAKRYYDKNSLDYKLYNATLKANNQKKTSPYRKPSQHRSLNGGGKQTAYAREMSKIAKRKSRLAAHKRRRDS